MSETGKTNSTIGSLPHELASAAAAKVDRGLHAVGVDPIHLDPHGKAADYSLKPDPMGSRDPIGRPDAHGSADGPDLDRVSSEIRATADDAADQMSDFAEEARDRASDLADDVRERLGGAAEEARTWVSAVHRDHMRRIDDAVVRGTDGLDRGRTAVEKFVTENPLLVGVVGVAAGLLLGALLPRTRQEDRNIGPYADEVRDQGLRYAREFTSRGREFVETALDPDNIQAAVHKAAAEPDSQGENRTIRRL